MPQNPLAQLAPLHLLIVEDDPFQAELSAEHYRELGLTVDVAANGCQALSRMDKQLPDLVLCDRLMPQMSGAELLDIVRGRGPEWQKPAFVFVTGLSSHRDRFSMLSRHPDGYLCKPIDYEQADQALAQIVLAKRNGNAVVPDTE